MNDPVLTASNISKSFIQGESTIHVLNDVSLTVHRGQTNSVMGASGSGKTTLLQILGGLSSPTSGSVSLLNQSLSLADDAALSLLRNQHLGFVYQLHHLLPEFNAIENVAMPQLIAGISYTQALKRAEHCLKLVEMDHRLTHTPAALSGGERQRVAIARAIVNSPECILADEPTGNLDENNAQNVMLQLTNICREEGLSLVLITHDLTIAQAMSNCYELSSGTLGLKTSNLTDEHR